MWHRATPPIGETDRDDAGQVNIRHRSRRAGSSTRPPPLPAYRFQTVHRGPPHPRAADEPGELRAVRLYRGVEGMRALVEVIGPNLTKRLIVLLCAGQAAWSSRTSNSIGTRSGGSG